MRWRWLPFKLSFANQDAKQKEEQWHQLEKKSSAVATLVFWVCICCKEAESSRAAFLFFTSIFRFSYKLSVFVLLCTIGPSLFLIDYRLLNWSPKHIVASRFLSFFFFIRFSLSIYSWPCFFIFLSLIPLLLIWIFIIMS